VIEFTQVFSMALLVKTKQLVQTGAKIICVHCGEPLERGKEPMTVGKLRGKGKEPKSLLTLVEGGKHDPSNDG
jgi:hypothetical protein